MSVRRALYLILAGTVCVYAWGGVRGAPATPVFRHAIMLLMVAGGVILIGAGVFLPVKREETQELAAIKPRSVT